MDPIDSWVDAAAVRRLAESLVAPASEPMETSRVAYEEGFVGFDRAAVATEPRNAPVASAVAPEPVRVDHHARAALAGARQLAERGGILGVRQLERPAAPPPQAPVAAAVPVSQQAPAPQQAPVAVAVPVPQQAPAPQQAPVPQRAPAPQQAPAPQYTPAPQQAPVAVAPAPQPTPAPSPVAVQFQAPAAPVQAEGLFMERLRAYGEWLHRSIAAKAFFVADREGELLIDEINSPKLLQVARTLAQASWSANRQAGSGPAVGSLHVKLGAESVLEVLPVMTRYGPLILGIIVPGLLPSATVQVVGSSLQRVVDGPLQRS